MLSNAWFFQSSYFSIATVLKRVSCLFIQKRFYKPFTCFFIQKHVLLIKTMCTKSIPQMKPRTQRHILKNIANFYVHLLGCIKTRFCKKIYVCQHLSSLQDVHTSTPAERQHFRKVSMLKSSYFGESSPEISQIS